MNNENKLNLEGQINEKKVELEKLNSLLVRYEKNYGRDRWYNRKCHDISSLRFEIKDLEARLLAST